MNESASRAVFLSYAREDTDAARRICEALRAVGVEVWFDQSELGGGDAWDQKIRKQIKECALLIPIISAATQARTEGYFRLEWRLADQRTHLMAKGRPFLLPVAIDGTLNSEAHVPDSFTEVQWTPLPGGETPPAFAARVKKLLGDEVGPASDRPSEAGPKADAAQRPVLPRRQSTRSWLVPTILGAVAVAALAFWRPWKNPKATTAVPLPSVAAPSATQPLLDRIWAIYEKGGDATTEDWALAMELGAQAVALDSLSAESWAAYAQATACAYYWGDRTPEHYAQALTRAQRAVSLSGDSFEACFALASVCVRKDATTKEGERLLRQLVEERPTDGRVLRYLGSVLEAGGQYPEALTIIDRALTISARDAAAWTERAVILHKLGRIAEAQEAVEKSLAIRVGPRALMEKAYILVNLTDDYPAGAAVIDQLPGPWLTREYETWAYGKFWLNHRQPEKALATFTAFGADTVQGNPRAYYTGRALDLLGRTEAAQVEWRAALKQVEASLATKPNDPNNLLWKAQLLACLGERAEAERALAVARQFSAPEEGIRVPETLAMLGQRAAAISDLIERWPKLKIFSAAALLRTFVLHDPVFDPLRDDPRYQAFVRKISEDPRFPIPRKTVPATAATATADDKSVAVLAFADLSAAHDSEYFSDGITEELLNALAKVPGLKVSARTSSFHFKGKDTPIPEIAQQLGVAYVVEGSVRKSGSQVRITAQLIKATDGFHVWSDTFTRELKEVFAVQDEIAGLIARNLSLKLGASSAAATASVNPEAFELYVQGRQAWNLRNAEGYARAEQLLNRASELAPDFARARAALADVALLRTINSYSIGPFGQRNSPDQSRLVAQIRQVLVLDPDMAEAHASLGLALMQGWNLSESESELRRAIALNPNYASAHHWLGIALDSAGQIDDALAETKLSADLDPLSPAILTNYGWALEGVGRYREALVILDQALALQPDSIWSRTEKARALIALGRFSEAVALVRPLPAGEPESIGCQVLVFGQAGLRAEADALLAKLNATVYWPKSHLLLAVGRREEALAALADPSAAKEEDALPIFFDPLYDAIRVEPRFGKFLVALGWTQAHARAQAWRKAHPPEKPEAKK